MFGVVPKTPWNRTKPRNDNNRIDLAARSLLIKTGKSINFWLNTRMGNKPIEKFLVIMIWNGETNSMEKP